MSCAERLVLGYLIFLTDENWDRRVEMVTRSLRSLSLFKGQPIDLLIIKNGCSSRVDDLLDRELDCEHETINLQKNYLDVAVHYCSFWRAQRSSRRYFAYTYDDFVVFDGSWAADAIQFMDSEPSASNMRLPAYVLGSRFFDVEHTPKSVNPDAVRHYVGLNEKSLKMWGVRQVGTHQFGLTNWYPNSRPTLWRTEAFASFSERFVDKSRVMQAFEFEMIMHSREQTDVTSAFLNVGMCRTEPVHTSERTMSSTFYNDVFVDVKSLRAEFDGIVDVKRIDN